MSLGKNSPIVAALGALKSPDVSLVSEWAERYRVISRRYSNRPGKWRNSNNPPAVAIMDAALNPAVKKITFMASSQVGKTECLLNLIGWYAHMDASPIMLISSTDELAQLFVKQRVRDMIDACPELNVRVAKAAVGRQAGGGNERSSSRVTNFSGGLLLAVGPNSVTWLSSNPVRILLADEIDRYPATAGGLNREEGDPLALALARTKSYGDRALLFQTSSPTNHHTSRIYSEYLQGSQSRYNVPCPECGEYQVLEFENLKWPRDGRGRADPENAYFVCSKNGCVITQSSRPDMLARGKWVAENPDAPASHLSFHLWAAYSPAMAWSDIAREFGEAAHAGEDRLRAFHNTALGRAWRDPHAEDLTDIDAAGLKAETPDLPDTIALTAGVDVQGDRFEVTTCAWRGTSYSDYGCDVIDHHIIEGTLDDQKHWTRLSEYLSSIKQGRHTLAIAAIDSGYQSDAVMGFALREQRSGRKYVQAVKGIGRVDAKYIHSVMRKGDPQQKKAGLRLVSRPVDVFQLGVNQIKNALAANLRTGRKRITFADHLDEKYFKQITSERRERCREQGRDVLRWRKIHMSARNEALDCLCYAFAAFHMMRWKPARFAEQNARNGMSGALPPPEKTPDQSTDAEAQPTPRRRRQRPLSVAERRRNSRRR